jgi:hypothetical protein
VRAPAPREDSTAWDLRRYWATQTEVVLVIDADIARVRGYIEHVAPTNSICVVYDGHGDGDLSVEIARITTVRRPHFHEPQDGSRVPPPPNRMRIPVQIRGQLSLPGLDDGNG